MPLALIAAIAGGRAPSLSDSQERNRLVLRKLKASGVWPEVKHAERGQKAEGPLEGMTFVVTGTLPTLSRDQAKELIIANGGKVIKELFV